METNNIDKYRRIDISKIFYALLTKSVYIVGIGIILALIVFIYSNFVTEKAYNSTAKLYVNSKQDDSATSTYLSNDYIEIITTRTVLEQVISELSLDISYEQLKKNIIVDIVDNSRIISITVMETSPIRAKRVADCVAKVSSSRISLVMNVDSVSIVQNGEVPSSPVQTSVMKLSILAFVIGVVVSSIIVIVMNMLKDTIVTTEDVEKYLKISVVGIIPMYEIEEDE